FSLTTSERTRPDIVTADLIVLQLVAHELAQEIGLTAVMDECSEEQLVPEYEEVPETGGGWLSGIQTTLDVGGIADPTPICDGINCVLYLVQFDFSNAGISAIAFIPYLGDAAKSTRLGGKVCHTVSGGTKLAGRAAMRISGYVLRVVVRYIPTGAFKIAYPNKLKMILGRFPHYRDIGDQGGHLFFDMADEWKTVTAKFGDDMGTAINRDALDIVAPLAQAGHVDIPLVLNPGETLFDLFARKGGNGTKGEIFYLAERYGLNVAEDGAGGLCFRTGTRAVDSGGVPLYLKQQFPEIDWGAYSRNNFPGLGERYVPRHLKARIMNGDWLKNIEQIRGLIR
ncbi:MAG: hypothetical protein KDD70_18900, partial [Bdellovibrionales bacterium]|nr:hypothetical protein [Bdellovibrionales bacterium]